MNKAAKIFLVTILLAAASYPAVAQDSSKRRTIDITSTFKPELRESSKLNFQASPVIADTVRPRLTYDIPSENLLFKYQPAELKPVALESDTLGGWGYSREYPV